MDAPGAQNNVENVIRGRANYGKWKFFWAPSALRCATPLTLGISCNAGASHQGRCALVCFSGDCPCLTATERPNVHALALLSNQLRSRYRKLHALRRTRSSKGAPSSYTTTRAVCPTARAAQV